MNLCDKLRVCAGAFYTDEFLDVEYKKVVALLQADAHVGRTSRILSFSSAIPGRFVSEKLKAEGITVLFYNYPIEGNYRLEISWQ